MKLDPECRAVCFDMDGTLLDTNVDYSRMTDLILDRLEKEGVPPEILDRNTGYKLSVDRALKWAYANKSPEFIQAISDEMAGIVIDLEMEHVDEAKPFPGVPEMLQKLKDHGYKIGVLTRGTRVYAEAALRIAGVDSYLDALVARDDFPENESKPSPIAMVHMAEAVGVPTNQITYVGDHKMDYMCSVESSTNFVAVSSGTFTKANWESVSKDILVLPTCTGIADMI